MRVLVAADKFKDSLTAEQACAAVAAGLKRTRPGWIADLCPLTDGGEGFARILTGAAAGAWMPCEVSDPLGRPVAAGFGVVESCRLPVAVRARLGRPENEGGDLPRHGRLAVIEMATACGLALLRPEERDVWRTRTTGTGELIAAASDLGVDGILIGVGGSATHDLGLGALSALGLALLAADGRRVPDAAPGFWRQVVRLDADLLRTLPPLWIACDVTNPLLGPSGAAKVYAPQKGLRPEDFSRLETETARMATLLRRCCGDGDAEALTRSPGAGAAGGIAFGLMAAVGARLVSGFALVNDWLRIERRMGEADLVITGEGRFDASSGQGKGPGSLVRAARALGLPVHVFAGRVDAGPDAELDAEETRDVFLHEITPRDQSLPDALAGAGRLLEDGVARAFAPNSS